MTMAPVPQASVFSGSEVPLYSEAMQKMMLIVRKLVCLWYDKGKKKGIRFAMLDTEL